MIYSKFTENQEENEETTIVTTNSQPTPLFVSPQKMQVEEIPQIKMESSSNSASHSAAFIPYVNRKYLKTLDTSNLERNMQVRHDLMLDDSYKAALPRLELSEQQEQEYWLQVKQEVFELKERPDRQDAPRLRALISEIREMVIELYPRCDVVTGEFSEFMQDTEFIIQQIKMGALDIPSVFKFIGHVMKKNCAPKRDVLVDAMIESECPIEGLRSALKLIELMKLDLANYKLDQMKPLIAKTAVSTERSFFSQLFNSGKISLDLTTKWLQKFKVDSSNGSIHETFVEAGVRLLVSPFVRETNQVPETFILDKKRLIGLHGKFQDLCIVQCLLLIFKQACASKLINSVKAAFSGKLLKFELLRLLEQSNTQISDISGIIIRSLKECAPNSSDDYTYIHSALNNIISPDNELFIMIEGKLLKRIKSKLNNTGEEITGNNHGLSDLNVLEEFDEVIRKFGILLQYNWSVFEPIYSNLLTSNDNNKMN